MGNKRKEIRTALVDLFTEAEDFEDFTFFSSRSSMISQTEQLPSITFILPDETATTESISYQRYIRTVTIEIELRVTSDEDVDNILDDTMADIEDFLITNSTISGTVQALTLIGSSTEVGHEGNEEIGLGVLTYEGKYIS